MLLHPNRLTATASPGLFRIFGLMYLGSTRDAEHVGRQGEVNSSSRSKVESASDFENLLGGGFFFLLALFSLDFEFDFQLQQFFGR